MKKQLLLFATCVALLSGCKDNDENGRPDSPATQPAITAFVFEAARNPQTLIMDIKCAIDGNEISGLIPYATDLDKLVPSFKGRFAQISVNHTVQQSGVSENDFTKEVVYTVTDSKGTSAEYKVNLFNFTGLPVVTVETDQRAAITSKENYVNGTLTISKTADFKAGYEGAMRIRGRGNATFGYPKKPYKIKLDENGDAIKSIAFNTFVDGKVKWSETLDSDGNLVSSAE